jgi:hypothetical protein
MSPVNPGPMWLTFDTPSGNFHSEFNELPAPAIHGPGSHTTFRSPTRVLAVGWRFCAWRGRLAGWFVPGVRSWGVPHDVVGLGTNPWLVRGPVG